VSRSTVNYNTKCLPAAPAEH